MVVMQLVTSADGEGMVIPVLLYVFRLVSKLTCAAAVSFCELGVVST